MAKLIVNPTSPSRREVPLSRTLLAIGRDPSNDVVLPDAMVSRRHAVIEYRGSQYFLRDCNSSNGSLINGDRISERGLRDGDLVAIGTARLLFRDDLVAEDAAGKVIHHPSAPRQQCPSCHEDYRKGDLFCRYCGSSLAPHAPVRTICTACGTAVPLPARFCTACGSRLGTGDEPDVEEPASGAEPDDAAPEVSSVGPETAPVAELVSPAEDAAEPALDEPKEPDDPPGPAAAASAQDDEPVPGVPEEPEGSAGLHMDNTTDAIRRPPLPRLDPPRLEPRAGVGPAPVARALAAAVPPPVPPLAGLVEARRSDSRPLAAVLQPTLERPPVRASALARLGAALVDAVIVGSAQALLSLPAFLYWLGTTRAADEPPADVPFMPILLSVSLAALASILGAVYHVYFWGVKGATPGKRLFGLVVQRQDGRQPIGPGRAALRLLGYGVSGLVLGIGFLMIALGGSGLHDQIAGTRVVRRPGL
jgi:uncharacterized RDD family membrane protein YckC